MPTYMVHVFCNECGQPHASGIVIERPEEILPNQSIGDVYDGAELPPELVNMTRNYFQCPKTRAMYQQRDNRQVFLVRMA
jgi:hypothetical protein